MRFDWKKFCDEYGVSYVTHGSNVARGHINIKCVWCGQSDPSEHLGLRLETSNPAWACWRNAAHSGRSPRRLVQKLLGCSFQVANEIIAEQLNTTPEDSELDRAVTVMKRQEMPTVDASRGTMSPLQLPTEFKPLHRNMHPSRYADMFLGYLASTRGFGRDAEAVAEAFKLHYALSGEFAWRLIVPFYVDGSLLGWTGRAIRNGSHHRYHSRGSKEIIFNIDAAKRDGARVLMIVEGPLDAIKLDYYGRAHGYTSVAVLGLSIVASQIEHLAKLCSRFTSSVILFDREDLLLSGLPLAAELEALSGHRVQAKYLADYKDPGEVPPEKVPQLCAALEYSHA